MYWRTLLTEVAVVAAVVGVLTHMVTEVAGPRRLGALATGATVGALAHVLFEVAGLNAAYCGVGAACRRRLTTGPARW